MVVREYGFDERLVMSNGHAVSVDLREVLLQCIPGAVHAFKSSKRNDRLGIDWWVKMASGRGLAVDAKVRPVDWAAAHPEQDDLAIETFSVVEKQKVGWSRDESKHCDYVIWLWVNTGRYCLIPFPFLCRVCQENWEDWRKQYKTAKQRTPWGNGHYHSECVFVPRREVWGKIYAIFGGNMSVLKVGA